MWIVFEVHERARVANYVFLHSPHMTEVTDSCSRSMMHTTSPSLHARCHLHRGSSLRSSGSPILSSASSRSVHSLYPCCSDPRLLSILVVWLPMDVDMPSDVFSDQSRFERNRPTCDTFQLLEEQPVGLLHSVGPSAWPSHRHVECFRQAAHGVLGLQLQDLSPSMVHLAVSHLLRLHVCGADVFCANEPSHCFVVLVTGTEKQTFHDISDKHQWKMIFSWLPR